MLGSGKSAKIEDTGFFARYDDLKSESDPAFVGLPDLYSIRSGVNWGLYKKVIIPDFTSLASNVRDISGMQLAEYKTIKKDLPDHLAQAFDGSVFLQCIRTSERIDPKDIEAIKKLPADGILMGNIKELHSPKCLGLLGKKMSPELMAIFGEISGFNTCSNCQASYLAKDVYAGKYDVSVSGIREALGNDEIEKGIHLLINIMRTTSIVISRRVKIAMVLGKLGGKSAKKGLVIAMDYGDGGIRDAAKKALSMMRELERPVGSPKIDLAEQSDSTRQSLEQQIPSATSRESKNTDVTQPEPEASADRAISGGLEGRCNFCSIEYFGDVYQVSSDRLGDLEIALGHKPALESYLRDARGDPIWILCGSCALKALRVRAQGDGWKELEAANLGSELNKLVDELLLIDKQEGVIGGASSSFDGNQRHKRAREIGEFLCRSGGSALMQQVATAFDLRGGRQPNLSFCWHEIRDKNGAVVWLA